MFKNELYHYGVLGMKWGVRKKRASTNSVGVSKSAKRYKKGEYKEAKRKAKENKARRIKKAYNSFLKDLDVLQKKGMGNDIDAVTNLIIADNEGISVPLITASLFLLDICFSI